MVAWDPKTDRKFKKVFFSERERERERESERERERESRERKKERLYSPKLASEMKTDGRK